MTHPTLPDLGAELSSELLALAPIGARRRPVKIVEHPAFRRYRSPVASLNRIAATATWRCRDAGPTITSTALEVA